MSEEVRTLNRIAWDRLVEKQIVWTRAVSAEVIAEARRGKWGIVLTPTKDIPRSWFPSELAGCDVLCLASGGGQQTPVLAAAGARVTVIDNSPKQLAQDQLVADREGLEIMTVEGDMRDLGVLADASFDVIVHPVSNIFVPEIKPVWREAFRVLRPGGALLSGICNPVTYIFDEDLADKEGVLEVKFPLPYVQTDHVDEEERAAFAEKGLPMEFSHTLEEQIGGQLEAGLVLTDFYDDAYPAEENDAHSKYFAPFFATRAVKPKGAIE